MENIRICSLFLWRARPQEEPARRSPSSARFLGVQVHLRALSLALSLVLLSIPLAWAQDNALHGALPMEEQRTRLDAFVAEWDVTTPHPKIDPVMWKTFIPEDNHMTPERVELGRKLYFETRLSADGTVACATCHDVSRGFTDQRSVSEGIRDQLGKRNAPTTMNALLLATQFLDGRSPTLEEQAKLPPINPIEMGQPTPEAVVKTIVDDQEYKELFQQAYGKDPNYEDMARAIAAFERTLVFLDAPFDRFLAGETDAISEQAKRGWALFNGKARCVTCHMINTANPMGTNHKFHNIGVAARHQDFERLAREAVQALQKEDGVEAVDRLALQTDLSELGRFLVTKNRADIGTFKTLHLRNIGLTFPYMHDGSMQTLWDVMDHYNKGGEPNPFLDGGIEPLALTEAEIDDMVEFMFTLTDERFAEENNQQRARQRELAHKQRPFRDEALALRRVLPFEQRVMGTPSEEATTTEKTTTEGKE
ncbi:MAG: cytochrome-c peroxidase [Candidatus Binatia bacterium]